MNGKRQRQGLTALACIFFLQTSTRLFVTKSIGLGIAYYLIK